MRHTLLWTWAQYESLLFLQQVPFLAACSVQVRQLEIQGPTWRAPSVQEVGTERADGVPQGLQLGAWRATIFFPRYFLSQP